MAIWQASRPTVIDSGVWERYSCIERSNFLVSKRIEDLAEALDASWLLTLHFFVCSAHESLESSRFCSILPFRVFTLESRFFFSFIFSFSFCLIVPPCTQKFKIYPEWVNDLSRWFWLKNRDNNLVDYEKFPKEKPLQSKYPHLIKMDFLGT